MEIRHFIFLFLMINTACELVVEVDVPKPQELLVVNCTFNSNGDWRAQISQNKYILDTVPSSFIDARITISRPDGSSQVMIPMEAEYEGIYYTMKDGEVFYDLPYIITVEKDGYPPATSSAIIPKPIKIISYVVDTTTNPIFESQWNGLNDVSVKFKDPPGENFYGLRLKFENEYEYYDSRYDSIVTQKSQFYTYLETRDPIVKDFMNNEMELIFSDKSFNNKEYNFVAQFEEGQLRYATALTIELLSITKDYYEYRFGQRQQWWVDGNPFAEPVSVRSNIENGYGIFAGYSIDSVRVELK